METSKVRDIVLTAITAGLYDAPVDPLLRRRIEAGEPVKLEELGFDSLGWMEFCISVELQTRLELLTSDIESMATLADIEGWLRERL